MMIGTSRDNTIFLRFLAILLVINSHMDNIYPISVLGTGGSIGNALFFMLAAFGLSLSEKYKPQTFTQYYTKRIVRIYPVVWINMILLMFPMVMFNYITSDLDYQISIYTDIINNPLPIIGMFFYPPYWFLQALMIFYFIGFFFLKNYNIKKFLSAMSLLIVIYIVAYLQFTDLTTFVIESTTAFQLIFYLMVFFAGIYFASIDERIIYKGGRDFLMLFGVVLLIYFHKYLMMRGIAGEYQFIQQLLIFPMLYLFLKVSKSPIVMYGIMGVPYVSNGIKLIGAMTLELYIVHVSIIHIVEKNILTFPLNIIVFLASIFVISYLFYRVNDYLVNYLKKI